MAEVTKNTAEESQNIDMAPVKKGGKIHNFAMKESTSGKEWIKDKSERLGNTLDFFSVLGQFRKKKREEIKKRFEENGIDLTKIDIDQAFRLLTRPQALMAGIRRIISTVPRAVVKTTEAVSRAGMGLLTAPKYLYQGLATIPGNLKNTFITHAIDEKQGYFDRWKNIVKSAARTIYQPITKPGKNFVNNRVDDIKDIFKAGKSLLATITINPYRRIYYGAQKPPHLIKAKEEKAQAKIDNNITSKADKESKAKESQLKLQEMIGKFQGVETMPETGTANEDQMDQINEDLGGQEDNKKATRQSVAGNSSLNQQVSPPN